MNLRTDLRKSGGVTLSGSSADFRKIMTDETGKWAAVIGKAGIKLD